MNTNNQPQVKTEDKGSILLTNIQRFSLHDGSGIRTTVFLKGCSLHCPWCSNPENLNPHPEPYIKDGIEGVYGKEYSVEELVHECLKDKAFYEGVLSTPDQWKINDAADIEKLPGGVTFSGGECLLQTQALVSVFEKLHEAGIHIAVETCLFCSCDSLSIALNHIDFFYVDMKILDPILCSSILHGNLELYLSNLDTLMRSGLPVVIRIPVIGGYTDDEENRRAVKNLLGKYKDRILKIELIKEHNLGLSKYQSLIAVGSNVNLPAYNGVFDELMEQYKVELLDLEIPVEVCKI